MSDQGNSRRVLNRRTLLKTTGALSAIGLAGCAGSAPETSTPSESGGGGGGGETNGGGGSEKEQAIKEWGQKLNDHAREADIDWEQFSGTTITMGMNVHPYTKATKEFLGYFEDLTGITVKYNTFPESQLWQKLTLDLNSKSGKYDGFFMGLWPVARYYDAGWVQNLKTFINDKDLTDKGWLHMEDYPKGAIDAFSYGGTYEGDGYFTGLPFGIEGYGCLAYDKPTFEKLGLSEPQSFEDVTHAAKTISESDKTDRAGICSRASSTTLSSANWATMFRTYGAEWLDYESREATLNSQKGIDSLKTFSTWMGDYGPADVGSFDWYKSNQAMGNGQVGMIYHTPNAFGAWTPKAVERAEWVPPFEGPDGQDPVAATWEWALGISKYSKNPKATWLFLQWANSRVANKLVSVPHWEGQPAYGHARSNWLSSQDDYMNKIPKQSWLDAHEKALSYVPSSPPPVPLQTPQNMDMMSNAAIAMNYSVTGTKSPKKALDEAAPKITEIAKKIPDKYIGNYNR
ncbi:MAG: extracellular solute-binding protein [Haloplanus sp.]